MNFSDQNIAESLKTSSHDALMDAPFGIIRMDHKGKIDLYNKYEAELAGLNINDVLGKNFFTDIAPCTNNFMVAQKYLDNQELDETINYIFTYKLSPTKVTLRLLRQQGEDQGFIIVKLQDGK